MFNNWYTTTIGEIADVYDGPHATPQKAAQGPIYLGISNLVNGRIELSSTEHLSEEDFAKWTRRIEPRAGDIVFSYETRLGEAALIPPGLRCCLGRRMGLLRVKKDRVVPEYLRYAYLGPEFQELIRQRTVHGSTVDRIPLIEMPQFLIRLPPLPEQRAIASILGALDDKIELNRRMNATLEAMARAIFQTWFVDFDPVRAKSEGRETGLPAEIAALFPDGFVELEEGLLPFGWRISDLGSEARHHGGLIQTGPFGSQLHAADYVEIGVPSIMPKDIAQRRVRTDSIAFVSYDDANRLARHRVIPGDIVYSRRGDVERHALIGEAERGWLCGTGSLLVRLGSRWPSPLYASLHLDQPRIKAWIAQHAIGATMPNLSTSILAQAPILVPNAAVLQAFQLMAGPLDSCYTANEAQNRTLAALRDSLLPKLISGQVRVPDGERLVRVETV